MDANYEQMTTDEIVAYYKRVRNYIEQGFRVDGLRDELGIISKTLKEKNTELGGLELEQYLGEIEKYLKTIRH